MLCVESKPSKGDMHQHMKASGNKNEGETHFPVFKNALLGIVGLSCTDV